MTPAASAGGTGNALVSGARGRWVIWGVPAFMFLIAFFHRVAPGVLAPDLMRAFGATGTIVGLLSATYFYPYAALMVPAGVLVDSFGPRRVVTTGSALMGAGTIAMAAARTPATLFGGRFAVGLGASVIFVGALKLAATWFPPRQFGTLSALTATAGVLGALAATAPLAALAARLTWRGAFWVVGLVTLACSALCWLVVRDRPGTATVGLEAGPAFRSVVRGAVLVLRNRHTWPPFLTSLCLYSASGNLMLWVVPFLRDVYGLSTQTAAIYATANALALLVSAPLTGFLSDRVWRRRKAPYVGLTCCSVVTWGALLATLGSLPLAGLYALFFLMGLVGGAFVLTWPIGREVNPPHLAGVAVAVVNLGGFVGAALTQGPVGAVLDAGWTGRLVAGARAYPVTAYRAAFGVCALFVLAAAITALFVRETHARNVHANPD
jgi:MFS family permease